MPRTFPLSTIVCLLAVYLGAPATAAAHCDTLSGPVVAAARRALADGAPTAVLVWVRESEEHEVREAFAQVMSVRGLNADAQALADRFFFETVVRLHRLGEGEPYTGLKDDSEVDPVISMADAALQSGDLTALTGLLSQRASSGLSVRFQHAVEQQKHAAESLSAGREYVAAYVEFIHYVERLHTAVTGAQGDER